jgi:cyclophilin family peptidyl-prolyl cis-trans isomerase
MIIDMKKLILGIAILAAAASVSCSCTSCSNNKDMESDSTKPETEMENIRMEEPEFEMVTSLGTMKLKLYSKTPKHRDNFVKLVEEKYYDGMRFHRVIEGFMIQGGDPYSRDTAQIDLWGQGGPGYTVPAEFVNEYWHKKGAIAAARKGDMANPRKASSGSQFYIVHDENNCLHLDGQYTIFGEVTEGLDVIDRIAAVATDRYDRPYEDVMIVSVKALNVEPETAPADSTAVQPADTTSAE